MWIINFLRSLIMFTKKKSYNSTDLASKMSQIIIDEMYSLASLPGAERELMRKVMTPIQQQFEMVPSVSVPEDSAHDLLEDICRGISFALSQGGVQVAMEASKEWMISHVRVFVGDSAAEDYSKNSQSYFENLTKAIDSIVDKLEDSAAREKLIAKALA
jgi:hypothetical protein